jgi:polysaccharide biosynthesis PFTS motif protein
MTGLVFFEEINASYGSLVKKYIKEGYTVYYFFSDIKYLENTEINTFIKQGNIICASDIVFDYDMYRRAMNMAHENLDYIFEKYFSESPSINLMTELFDSNEILGMFQKEVLLNLEAAYTVELKINDILNNQVPDTNPHFVPKNHIDIHCDGRALLDKKVKLIQYSNFRIRFNNMVERFFFDNIKSPKKGILLIFYPIFILTKKFKGISRNKCVKKYQVGISIPRHPRSIFSMNYLTETIFINDDELSKEDVIFIDENGSKNIEGYIERSWNFVRLLDDRETLTLDVFWNKIVKKFLPVWFKTIFISVLKEPLFCNTKRRILQDYITWNIFLDNYQIKNYVKRLLPDSISKIKILSENDIKTWFVFPDNTSIDYYLDRDISAKNQTLYSFMVYDNAVVYGNNVERFFKKHRNSINRYLKNGVLFSQLIEELQEGILESQLPDFIRNKELPEKIIGVFDTSFNDEGFNKIQDGIKFGEDILRFLEDLPDIGIIFKAMKWPEEIPYLNEIYNKLKNHPRVLLFYMWDKEGISASEIIACSEFIISCAYTSPTAEALGTKKKAIYYDVSGRNVGEGYYYNRYPNFVAHNYEDLKNLTNYWLNVVTDKEFEMFLDTNVKDEIDPFLDGKALTRLRGLLME